MVRARGGVEERLRLLLVEHQPSKIRWRLADLHDATIDAQLPKRPGWPETIQTCWPTILAALAEGVSNARTECFNRIMKQHQRVGCDLREGVS